MVNYYCPGFFESQYMYNIYMWLWNEHRECFNDNVKISKVYGCFPGMTWNGGSYWIGGGCPLPKAEDMVEWYKEKGLTVQLTMTNPVLEERDLYDRYCNGILETLESEDVEILVASPTLEKHIRENYPKYKVDLSIIATTKERHEKTVDDYVKKLDDYNIVVLPRKYGKDIDALSKVPMDKRGRLEILALTLVLSIAHDYSLIMKIWEEHSFIFRELKQ